MLTPRIWATLKILLFIGVVALGNYLTQWFIVQLSIEVNPSNEPIMHRIILISMIAYTLLMSIPFVPGAEIGVAALMILGPKIALLVYLSTVAAFSLSFAIGRFIPEKILIKFLQDLHLHRMGDMLIEFEGLDSKQRLNLMLSRSPRKFVPYLIRYRYLALMVAINVPGNIVIGGGGGIALMAGLSRLFTPPMYLLAVAIAVSPIPVVMMIYGNIFN